MTDLSSNLDLVRELRDWTDGAMACAPDAKPGHLGYLAAAEIVRLRTLLEVEEAAHKSSIEASFEEGPFLRQLLADARLSVERDAESNCVCQTGEPQCKYCRPARALLERIDEALAGSQVETSSGDADDAARWRFAKEQMNYSFDGENRTHYMKAQGREDFQETIDRRRGSSENGNG